MVKKHYSSQNFRVDHIRRLRLALEDHILAIKMQITEGIDINEPEGEGEVRQQVAGSDIYAGSKLVVLIDPISIRRVFDCGCAVAVLPA